MEDLNINKLKKTILTYLYIIIFFTLLIFGVWIGFLQESESLNILSSSVITGAAFLILIIISFFIWLLYKKMTDFEKNLVHICESQYINKDESQKRLERLIGNLPGMVYRCINDESWTMEFLSPGCLDLCGYRPEDIVNNKKKSFIDLIHEDDKGYVWSSIQKALNKGEPFQIEYRIMTIWGKPKWIWEHGTFVTDENGTVYLEGVILDNDERIRFEQKLLESETRFRMLFEHADVSIWNEDMSRIFKRFEEFRQDGITDLRSYLKKRKDLVTKMASEIVVLNVNDATLKMFGAKSEGEFLARIDTTFSEDSLDVFIDELCAIWEGEDYFRAEVTFNTFDGREIDTILSFKIPKLITDFYEIPVSMIDITNRKNVETKLEQNSAQLETLINTLPDLIWLKNENGVYLSCNKRFEDFFGAKHDDIVGRTDYDFVDKQLADFFREHDKIAMDAAKPTINEEEIVFASDGHKEVLETIKTPMYNFQGSLIGILGIGRDITQRKKSEQNLKESQDRYKALFDGMSSGVVIYRATDDKSDFIIEDFNHGAELIDNIDKNQLIGKRLKEIFPSVEQFGLFDILREVDETGESQVHPISEYKDDRINGWRENYVYKLPTGEIVAIYEDKTKEKEASRAKVESEKLFSTFMDYIPIGVFIKDKNNTIIYANKHLKELFSIETYEDKKLCEFLPNDICTLMKEEDSKVLEDGYLTDRYTLSNNGIEYGTFDIHRFKIIKDEKVLIGQIFIDITQQFEYIKEIKRLTTAIENSPLSIIMTDLDGNITYANNWFFKVTGYTSEEIIGNNPRILKSNYTTDIEYEALWDTITNKKVWTGNLKNKKQNGEEYWESAIIIPVVDDYGDIISYMGIKQETTEQVMLKEELKNKEEIMIAQSRHAAMGEMISMIAHQWRQPLSIISMGANNILADIELGIVEESALKDAAYDIISQSKELSHIIDDFRNFFRPVKTVEDISPEDIFNDVFSVVGKSLQSHAIKIKLDYKFNKEIKTYSRELMQVLINIIKNSKEVLTEREIEEKYISIVTKENKGLEIIITDNGGGIDEKILSRVFEPYFSTKSEKQGTGLGLYMSKIIIEKHLSGIIEASNSDAGASFKISLPYRI